LLVWFPRRHLRVVFRRQHGIFLIATDALRRNLNKILLDRRQGIRSNYRNSVLKAQWNPLVTDTIVVILLTEGKSMSQFCHRSNLMTYDCLSTSAILPQTKSSSTEDDVNFRSLTVPGKRLFSPPQISSCEISGYSRK
jgi:hypothetical protein